MTIAAPPRQVRCRHVLAPCSSPRPSQRRSAVRHGCAHQAPGAGHGGSGSQNRFSSNTVTPSATAMAAIRGACASVGKPSYGAVPDRPTAARRRLHCRRSEPFCCVSVQPARSSAARTARQMLRPDIRERHVAARCGSRGQIRRRLHAVRQDRVASPVAERRRGYPAGSPRRGCLRRRRAGKRQVSDFRLARRCTASACPATERRKDEILRCADAWKRQRDRAAVKPSVRAEICSPSSVISAPSGAGRAGADRSAARRARSRRAGQSAVPKRASSGPRNRTAARIFRMSSAGISDRHAGQHRLQRSAVLLHRAAEVAQNGAGSRDVGNIRAIEKLAARRLPAWQPAAAQHFCAVQRNASVQRRSAADAEYVHDRPPDGKMPHPMRRSGFVCFSQIQNDITDAGRGIDDSQLLQRFAHGCAARASASSSCVVRNSSSPSQWFSCSTTAAPCCSRMRAFFS